MGPGLSSSELTEDLTQLPENQETPNDDPQDTTGVSENDEVDITGNEPVIDLAVPGTSSAQTRTPD